MRTRTRGIDGTKSDHVGDQILYVARNEYLRTPLYSGLYYRDYEVTKDEVHPNFPKEGGPFDSRKISTSFNDSSYLTTGNVYWSGYLTKSVRRAQPISYGTLPPSNLNSAASSGPDGWNRFRPARPHVNLAQAIAELRDFTSLFKFKLKKFKNLGEDYLNVQFGWMPFLSDIRRTIQTYKRLDEHMARLKKYNGKWQRRGGTLAEDSDTEVSDFTAVAPSNGLTNIKGSRTRTTTSKLWFSGAFRYYIPGLQEGNWGKFRTMSHLYGLDITPALVWELTPFSWLADWSSNIGSVISNFSAMSYDHLAAKYAYCMLHTTTVDKYHASFDWSNNIFDQGLSQGSGSCSAKITMDSKARAVASPFGFNFEMEDLNSFQISILGALGIARYF